MSILSPGNLFLVNDDRALGEVRITIWDNSNHNWGSLAVSQLVPGDTLVLIGTKNVVGDKDTQAWNIIAKGRIGHIFVDEETRRCLRLLRENGTSHEDED